jgi:hypothetical protein
MFVQIRSSRSVHRITKARIGLRGTPRVTDRSVVEVRAIVFTTMPAGALPNESTTQFGQSCSPRHFLFEPRSQAEQRGILAERRCELHADRQSLARLRQRQRNSGLPGHVEQFGVRCESVGILVPPIERENLRYARRCCPSAPHTGQWSAGSEHIQLPKSLRHGARGAGERAARACVVDGGTVFTHFDAGPGKRLEFLRHAAAGRRTCSR